MKNRKIIIVDDEPVIRKTLCDFLSTDYETASFESAEEFLGAIKNFELEDGMPTCILLDFQLTGMSGVELQDNLKLINVEFPIIFMSGNAHKDDIINAWRGGAVDFILKPFTASQITDILVRQFDLLKQREFRPPLNQATITSIPITQREAQVLLLLGEGHQQSEIAQILGISLRTVKMFRSNLKEKLYLNTLMELGRYCDQHKSLIKKIARY